jgi:hypothetical protein
MHFLRKYQKTILAVMGVVCMITFVVGPYLLDMVQSASSGGRDPVVVTWQGGRVTESKLDAMQTSHMVAVRFLFDVINTAVERGGQPIVNGEPVTAQTISNLQNPGIPGQQGESGTIQTMLLAERARELGIHADQDSAKRFLYELAPEVPETEWQAIVSRNVPSGMAMSLGQVLDQIAYDLRAQHATRLAQSALFAVTPSQMWDYHNRLNRRYTIEAYPVDVVSRKKDVAAEPTNAELLAIFEKGKNNYPDPSLPEPGFRRPHRIAFEYLKVDFEPFLTEAKKQITDEQIAKQYELDIAQGKHKVVELPPDPTKPPEPPMPPQSPGDKPAEPKPGEEPPADKDKPADEAKPVEDAKPADKPAEKPAEEPAEPAAEDEEETEPAAETQPADSKPADSKPAEEKPDEAKPAETKPGEAKPAETKPLPKFKKLEEVADDIRTGLAQPIAQEKRDAAIKQAIADISDYGRKFFRWKGVQEGQVKSSKVTDPGQLNLEGIATKHGFKAGSTKLVDQHEIREYDLGKNVMEFDFTGGQFRPLSFADLAYRRSDPLYSPQEANSTEPDISYIYWRTAEEDAKDVTFEEARDQVVEAWKLQKAFELAKDEAQKLAEKAKAAKSLKDVVDPAKVLTPPPFSWLTTGSLAFGFGQPSLSNVLGVDLAGQEFMEGVFSLSPGEAGLAPNQAHTTVYVVRVLSQEPTEDVLREQFLETGSSAESLFIARNEMFQTSRDWYEELEKDMQLAWKRQPDAGQQE